MVGPLRAILVLVKPLLRPSPVLFPPVPAGAPRVPEPGILKALSWDESTQCPLCHSSHSHAPGFICHLIIA